MRSIEGDKLLITGVGKSWDFTVECKLLRSHGFVHPMDVVIEELPDGAWRLVIAPLGQTIRAHGPRFDSWSAAQWSLAEIRNVLERDFEAFLR